MANPAFINRGGVKMMLETAYGTQNLTEAETTIYRPWDAVIEKTVAQITTNNLRKGLEPQMDDKVAGLTGGTVTVTGQLQLEDVMLLKQIFLSSGLDGTAGKEYAIQETQAAVAASNYSTTIYKLLPDSAANKFDIGIGSVLETLVITGSTGSNITFTATYRCKTVNSNTAATLDGTAQTILTDCVPFTTAISSTEQATIDSFTLTITNLFADDQTTYQNSQSKLIDAVIGTTVTLQTQSLRKAATVNTGLMSGTAGTITLLMTDSSLNSWSIALSGKYTTCQFPAPQNGIMNAVYTFEAMGDPNADPAVPAIEITVA